MVTVWLTFQMTLESYRGSPGDLWWWQRNILKANGNLVTQTILLGLLLSERIECVRTIAHPMSIFVHTTPTHRPIQRVAWCFGQRLPVHDEELSGKKQGKIKSISAIGFYLIESKRKRNKNMLQPSSPLCSCIQCIYKKACERWRLCVQAHCHGTATATHHLLRKLFFLLDAGCVFALLLLWSL